MHICNADEAEELAAKMLGGTLVTKQVRRQVAAGRWGPGEQTLGVGW